MVLTQAAAKTGLPVQAVEKDLWVTVVLHTVFTLPIASHLVFKGGTSLSKVWKGDTSLFGRHRPGNRPVHLGL